MERVEAELHGWHAATHRSKHDTDAGFKAHAGVSPAEADTRRQAVRLGVASHNLFDIALALVLRELSSARSPTVPKSKCSKAWHRLSRGSFKSEAGSLLFYAPIVKHEDFGSALAYLIRRLDENTAEGNFLASLFSLRPGSSAWDDQCTTALSPPGTDRHKVPRPLLPLPGCPGARVPDTFTNEPDSDWTQPDDPQEIRQRCRRRPMFHQVAGTEASRKGTRHRREPLATDVAQCDWRKRSAPNSCAAVPISSPRSRFASIALLREEGKKDPGRSRHGSFRSHRLRPLLRRSRRPSPR